MKNNIGVQGLFYLGVISDVLDDYKIIADIPGVIQGINAYPLRDTLDEPKVGDPIILLGLDPEYDSYYLYWKIKENDFSGFRAYGKEISIEEGKLVIRSFSGENKEDGNKEPGQDVSRIELDKDGNITILSTKEITVNANMATVNAVDVEIGAGDSGIGTLTVKSQGVIPDTAGGPFIAFPGQLITPTPGTPIPTGSTIILKK